jgi:cytochrome P450 monooxygenase
METEDLPVLGSQPPVVGRMNPLLRRLQASQPISKVRTPAGDEAWLVTRYAEVKQLLLDDRLGRSHPDPPNMPRYFDSPLLDMLVKTTDPEADRQDHVQTRSVLTPLFTARRMARLRPLIAERVNDAVDAILAQGPPADMYTQFSLPLSFGVLCHVLGVSEMDKFRGMLSRSVNVVDLQDSQEAPLAVLGFLAEVATSKRACPGDDVISELCAALADDGLVGGRVGGLAFAYQATATVMTAGIALLAAHPDQRDLLIKDRTLLPGAVEEALRMGRVAESFTPRYASADFEMSGVTIKTGDLVLCDHFSASLDDRVFDEPERFDITRSPNPHLAFSRGMWHCIGAPLAHMEIEEVFSALVSRMPTIQLAVPLDKLLVSSGEELGKGLVSVPVTW